MFAKESVNLYQKRGYNNHLDVSTNDFGLVSP